MQIENCEGDIAMAVQHVMRALKIDGIEDFNPLIRAGTKLPQPVAQKIMIINDEDFHWLSASSPTAGMRRWKTPLARSTGSPSAVTRPVAWPIRPPRRSMVALTSSHWPSLAGAR